MRGSARCRFDAALPWSLSPQGTLLSWDWGPAVRGKGEALDRCLCAFHTPCRWSARGVVARLLAAVVCLLFAAVRLLRLSVGFDFSTPFGVAVVGPPPWPVLVAVRGLQRAGFRCFCFRLRCACVRVSCVRAYPGRGRWPGELGKVAAAARAVRPWRCVAGHSRPEGDGDQVAPLDPFRVRGRAWSGESPRVLCCCGSEISDRFCFPRCDGGSRGLVVTPAPRAQIGPWRRFQGSLAP